MRRTELTVHDLMTIDLELGVLIGPADTLKTIRNQTFRIYKEGNEIGDVKSKGRFFGYDELRDAINTLLGSL
ncbi:MAG: hypothetical protein Q7T51_02940 [Candidatus Moranbacteria bacterium]|nr:hypothetical protein [Candidatus Moranbacteria bacterium]